MLLLNFRLNAFMMKHMIFLFVDSLKIVNGFIDYRIIDSSLKMGGFIAATSPREVALISRILFIRDSFADYPSRQPLRTAATPLEITRARYPSSKLLSFYTARHHHFTVICSRVTRTCEHNRRIEQNSVIFRCNERRPIRAWYKRASMTRRRTEERQKRTRVYIPTNRLNDSERLMVAT